MNEKPQPNDAAVTIVIGQDDLLAAEAPAPKGTRVGAWLRKHGRKLVIAAVCLVLAGFVGWLFAFLRPDTWRYYTDERTFRQLARDCEPRLVLWEDAVPVDGTFNVPGDVGEPAISPDGARLVFTRGLSNGNADLFLCRWNGQAWTDAEPLRALNSPFNELGPAFSHDGDYLFFTTDRPGGPGGYDIWASRWDGSEFAWPVPFTVMVNSTFDECDPAPSETGDRLYFSSNRPKTPLTDDEKAMSDTELRRRFQHEDYDLYLADRIPAGITNQEVERAQSMLYYLRGSALADTNVMAKLGGSTDTEAAVDRALEWLARSQETNGNWSIAKHGGDGGHDMAATAFALLTFFGRGERHDRDGKYRDTVDRGLKWMIREQDPLTGDLRGATPAGNAMYDQGIASLALAEAYGLTKDENLYGPAQSALDFLADTQNPDDGGWRYRPLDAGDTSVSGWAIMALKSGELSGLHVPRTTYDGIRKWLTSVSSGKDGGLYGYRPGEGGSRPAMIATGFFCSQLMGLSPNTPKAFETAASLKQTGLRTSDVYYGYYGTLCAYQNQGPLWRQWRDELHRQFLKTQGADGSWLVTEGHGNRMGRVIATALVALSLQAHYRYTPLYGLGYDPDPARLTVSDLNLNDLEEAPVYRRAKRMADISSPRHDRHPVVTGHGDFLYFVSNRRGGLGGLDLYRCRISNEGPLPPESLGASVNSRYDETAPAVRMAGFDLVFSSNWKQGGGEDYELFSSMSRRVERRHIYDAMPAIGWMLTKYRWRFGFMGLSFLAFILCLRRAGRKERKHKTA